MPTRAPTFKPAHQRTTAQRRQDFDRSRADAPWRRWYGTARWQKLRTHQLSLHPLCEWCLESEIVAPATEVHHTDGGHKGDEEKFWTGPFVSTCKPCHSSRGQREDHGQKVVVFGADGWPL